MVPPSAATGNTAWRTISPDVGILTTLDHNVSVFTGLDGGKDCLDGITWSPGGLTGTGCVFTREGTEYVTVTLTVPRGGFKGLSSCCVTLS
jgi:hypothetical protein